MKPQESAETSLDLEVAQEEEKGRLGGILQTLGNKARAQVAALSFMMVTSALAAGWHKEASAAEKRGYNAPKRPIQEQLTQDQIREEFAVKKETFAFTVKIPKEARKVLEEHQIRFNEETGDFFFANEKRPGGVLTLKQKEVNGVVTNHVEVSTDEVRLPGAESKTRVRIQIYNSDQSIETITLIDGRITDFTKGTSR